MKKFFSLIVMAALSACFVSCGSDGSGKEDPKPPIEASVFSSVKVDISLKFTEATLNMANIVISLPNSEGKMVRESVLKPEWERR